MSYSAGRMNGGACHTQISASTMAARNSRLRRKGNFLLERRCSCLFFSMKCSRWYSKTCEGAATGQ